MAYVKERIGNVSTVTLLAVVLAVSIVVAISIGVVAIPYSDVWDIVVYNVFDKLSMGYIQIGDPATLAHGTYYDIVWNIRSPRVFMAAIVGMILALAGVVMQATVQNPLADPYILGMSSGASLGATFAIAVGAVSLLGVSLGSAGIAVFAFIGSLVASFAVLGLSSAEGKPTTVKLILSGTIISSLFGAFSNLIVVLFADAEEMQSITYWLLGSFASASWTKLAIPLLALVLALAYFITQVRSLITMLMGDEVATTLGIDLARKRVAYVMATAVLTACAVCFCGVIGFVGLMIPHIVRGITGNNHWKLLPVSVLVGGIFMVWADVAARTVLGGSELPIGIITAVCGAPIFAYIMIKKTYTFSRGARMIDVDQLQVTLTRKIIVDGVSINVGSHEFVGVIGPYGSGKSTLLKTIYRVLKKSGGAVAIDGRDIDDMTLKESALKTSVVTQHNYYNFDFKARDVVLMGRAPHKRNMEMDNEEDYRIVDEALERVGMTDFADRSFYTLSGGEQQRIVLARALAQQTECMILDEPTNHLDVKYQLQLMDVVGSLGLTVLAALHDLNIAAAYCDRLYMMKDGRIVGEGAPEEVLTEESIREVYGVEATVSVSPNTGLLNIEYHPSAARHRYPTTGPRASERVSSGQQTNGGRMFRPPLFGCGGLNVRIGRNASTPQEGAVCRRT